MFEQVKPENAGGSVELAVKRLLDTRLETIPWHVSNVGVEIADLRSWEHRSLLKMLRPEKKHEVLCAYDTLGILTHLCISLGMSATYHSTRDLYGFAEVPVHRYICDPVNMPPKHPFFYHYKYDCIVTTFLFTPKDDRSASTFTLLGTLKRLLKPDGFFVLSFCESTSDNVVAAVEDLGMAVDDMTSRADPRGLCGIMRVRNKYACE